MKVRLCLLIAARATVSFVRLFWKERMRPLIAVSAAICFIQMTEKERMLTYYYNKIRENICIVC